jgi:catechol 2,3-dioxygenase-like lactoylglutathione lyase family enzyme
MSTTQVGSDATSEATGETTVPMRLEVTVLPVSDVDRAKAFYARLGWRLDADLSPADDYRVVQFTPPGSSASIQFGVGMTTDAPGSAQGLMMAVQNIEAAREALTSHGAEVGEIWHGRGISPGTTGHQPGPDPERATYRTYTSFTDPDGNRFILQEITERLPGRISEMDVAALAELLQETATHHGEFEAVAPPHDWWDWYAAYANARETGSTPEGAAATAGRYMADVKGVVVPSARTP